MNQKQNIYTSSRIFTLTNYVSSHSKIVLRSYESNEYEFQIEIIFSNVFFMQMNFSLDGVIICQLDNPNILNQESVKEFLKYKHNRLYSIESNGEIFYLAASHLKVYKLIGTSDDKNFGLWTESQRELIAENYDKDVVRLPPSP